MMCSPCVCLKKYMRELLLYNFQFIVNYNIFKVFAFLDPVFNSLSTYYRNFSLLIIYDVIRTCLCINAKEQRHIRITGIKVFQRRKITKILCH